MVHEQGGTADHAAGSEVALVAPLHDPPYHAGTHAAQSDHSQLHIVFPF